MTVDEKLWPSRKSEGADVSTIEELVRRAIPDFHIIRDDDVVMSRTTAIKQRERYDELLWRIRSPSIDDDFVRELIPDFEDQLNGLYETGDARNWATDQQKIIGMLRDKYQDWLSEVGRTYLEYLTDGELDTFLAGVPPDDATSWEKWIHSVGESYLDHLTTAETVKQSYNWLIDRKIPAVVRRFECLIERGSKFVGRVDGGPMVDRKTRVRRSMLDHWVDKFYRKMQELKREDRA